MDVITTAELPALFKCIALVMQENEKYLCQLDAEMGDGDLGLTMRKGFAFLPETISELLASEQDLGRLLMKAGMKMADVVPSTMGTLMGSGIMSAGKALTGRNAIDGDGLAIFYRGFADGIMVRGKCAPGDRTLLDAMAPTAEKAASCPDRGLRDVAKAALDGAEAGLEATKSMLPKFGKAAVFSAKAVGRVDQGAVVVMLFTKAVSEFCAR